MRFYLVVNLDKANAADCAAEAADLIKLWGMVIMPLFLTVQGYKPHCHIGDDE